MTNSQRLAIVREYFSQWLRAEADCPDTVVDEQRIECESILIRDGFYCGRKFEASGFHAVWFMEEDQLKIHARGGDVVAVMTGDEIGDESLLPGMETETIGDEAESDDVRTERQEVVSISTPIESSSPIESEPGLESDSDDEQPGEDVVKKAA